MGRTASGHTHHAAFGSFLNLSAFGQLEEAIFRLEAEIHLLNNDCAIVAGHRDLNFERE